MNNELNHTHVSLGRQTLFDDFFLLGHLHLSGMWCGVAPTTYTKKKCVHKRL